jgi:TonB family protein
LSGIFVSYRRSDSQGEAGRLFDDLVKHFGEDTVFMDVAAIEAGRDFRKAIEEGVTKCGVLLVVIGVEWLDAKDERGARRLNDPSDFVRIETASALKRDIPVIPVLVRGAKMPSAEQLPEELKELAYRNCIELTHARWRSDIQLLIEALRRLLGEPSQAGTSARPNEAKASARPGTAQKEAAGASKLEDGSSARIDPAAVQRVTRELALRIGPIAGIVVKRAASQCSSVEDLYLKVAEEIDSRDEREKFLRGRDTIPSTPPLPVAKDATPASNTTTAAGLPPPSEGHDVPSQTARPATGRPLSNRRKYLLPATVGGVLLILLVVLVARFAPGRGAGSSPTAQTSAPETHVAESAPVKTATPAPPAATPAKSDQPIPSPAARAADDSRPRSPGRVRVPEEVSNKLLISTVLPVYPPLARQARLQGVVVLDAEISKDGTVETLRVIRGHPLLIQAALKAVKQWRYKPYVRNGEPVAVNTQISVGFSLSGG